MFKLDLEKAEEPEFKLPTSVGSQKRQVSSRKTPTSAFLMMPKLLTVWITIKFGKFFKRWEYQITLYASCEICMQVTKQPSEQAIDKETAFKLGKEDVVSIFSHPAYLTHIPRTLRAMLGWMKHCGNQDCWEKYQ